MKYIVTNTAQSLNNIIWKDYEDEDIYIQNISANDIYIDNKSTNILTEWVVLKAWNENVYRMKNLKDFYFQASWNSEIRVLFS